MPDRSAHDSGRRARDAGVPRDPQAVAECLGISRAALEMYLRARGGVPDGSSSVTADAVIATLERRSSLVTRALPAPSPERTTPWVKRDRPRYFMPG
jgi:hypothetical protein